jgi:DNA-binding HxlR family transcriptional regulator
VRRTSLASFECPIAQTLDVVGDPWTLLVVRDAFFGVCRFEDFRRSLDIPRATLSARLMTLVEHGVLERRAGPERPVRHHYLLTEKGRALGPVLTTMLQWGNQWSSLGDASVELVDLSTGRPVRPVVIDQVTGRPVSELRLTRQRRSGAPVAPGAGSGSDEQIGDGDEAVGEGVDVVDR